MKDRARISIYETTDNKAVLTIRTQKTARCRSVLRVLKNCESVAEALAFASTWQGVPAF